MANIIVLPYDYIFQTGKHKLNLKNAIIIFDEAHNIDSKARDVFSKTIKRTEILKILEKLTKNQMKLTNY